MERELVLKVMKEAGKPIAAGEVSTLSGLDRKVVDKVFAELKKEGAIVSPVRCRVIRLINDCDHRVTDLLAASEGNDIIKLPSGCSFKFAQTCAIVFDYYPISSSKLPKSSMTQSASERLSLLPLP